MSMRIVYAPEAAPLSTLSSNSSTRQVHRLDLEGLLDDLEGYVGRFPQARQYSPRTRVALMREDIKRGFLGPRPVAVNVSSGEPVHGNGTLEWGSYTTGQTSASR